MNIKILFLLVMGWVFVSCEGIRSSLKNRVPSGKVLDKSGYLYDPNDTSCDGFPRLAVQTAPGTCLGLVLARNNAVDPETDRSFIKPRTIVQIPATDEFLVLDMGGWKENNGRLFWLKKFRRGKYSLRLVKHGWNTPHALRLAPDGHFYLGEKDKIVRFKWNEGKLLGLQTVVKGLPSYEGHMHPLTQIAFDPRNNDLYINSGAPSDHCFKDESGDYQTCPEDTAQGLGSIYRIPGKFLENIPKGGVKNWEVTAKGLRNSMAMVVHPSGKLIQGENSRDFPEFEEPYEEMNVIELDPMKTGRHYGWPYCYNFHATSPEWEFVENNDPVINKRFDQPLNCKQEGLGVGEYKAPYLLMPPHVAPLDVTYAPENALDGKYRNHLFFTWHGHQPSGNRVVAYPLGEDALPLLQMEVSAPTFSVDAEGSCPLKKKFTPRGGVVRNAFYKELISGWDKKEGLRPEGAPVGMTWAEDGSLWIVEDRASRVVLRLAAVDEQVTYKDDCQTLDPNFVPPEIKHLAWRHFHEKNPQIKENFLKVQSNLIRNHCMGCHGDFQSQKIGKDKYMSLDFFIEQDWIVPGNPEESKLYGSIAHLTAFTPMPPADKEQFFGTRQGERIIDEVRTWIEQLDPKVPQGFKKYQIKANRNIRPRPTLSNSKKCGKLVSLDYIYLAEGELKERIQADGWVWEKIFLPPGHTRLFKNACSGKKHPVDGVFYVGIHKIGASRSSVLK